MKTFETPAGSFTALRGVDLKVDAGEFVAVIGKSGSGKSTLINAIAGIDRPTTGEVLVAGTPVHSLDENAVAAWRGVNLGVIFQFFQLLPTLTLVENVILPMEFSGRGSSADRRQRAMALLERVEMAEHAYKLPSQVSGGQQQRVAIARALANDPLLIVADEPTGSLDSRTADTIFQLFEELVDQGKTILMVTHDSDLASRASRVVLIVDGEVVESHVRSALAGVSAADLVDVNARLEPVLLAAGATIFSQGDVADRFYIVVRGAVEVLRTRRDGSSEVVTVLQPGQHFGEAGLQNNLPRNATVRVSQAEGASLVSLDADSFRRLVGQSGLANAGVARVMREGMTAATIRGTLPATYQPDLASIAAHVQRLTFAQGATILSPGEPLDWFCVVADGVVEVMDGGGDSVAFRYREGRHFGTTGLTHDGLSIATLRAGHEGPTGATIVAIPASVLEDVVASTGLSHQHIGLLLAEADNT